MTYPSPPRRGHGLRNTLIAIGVVIALCLFGSAIAALSTSSHDRGSAPTLITPIDASTTAASRPAPATATTAAKAATPRVATIDGDDLVHVGEDVPAGTYRAAAAIEPGDVCYWLKSGDAEGDKIIDNGLPQGGRPQVTLKTGQWFTSQGCPAWRRK